jgi:hypothetical protein
MSHFSVLVITDNEPTDDLLQRTLLPWHQYECTGIEEYLEDIDKTDEVAKEFNKSERVVALPDGRVFSRWDERFYVRETPGDMRSQQKFVLPDGAEEKEITADEARELGLGYKDMDTCADEYFGIKRANNGRFYKRTNPNARWDSWSRGGRYRGRLLVKRGAVAFEGRPGAFGNGPHRVGGVDSCRMADLDLDRMAADAIEKAAKEYDEIHAVIAGRMVETWEQVRAKHPDDIGAARDEYWGQPPIKDLFAAKHFIYEGLDEMLVSRNDYLEAARKRALSAFAVVKDGKWYERGKMGWWACVSNEKEADKWDEEFAALVRDLPKEKWITVVDCHI